MTCNLTKFKGKFKGKNRLAWRKLDLVPGKSCGFYLNFYSATQYNDFEPP